MEPLVRVEGVSKFYPRVHRPGERLRAFAALLAGKPAGEGAEVLHDVSLEVHRGQSFGIIGENGAGKSTLLKILAGVTAPTSGEVEMRGTVASILELGSAFHGELTGRQNISLNAAMFGLDRDHVLGRTPGIIEFSELGRFIDRPIKTYSTGMAMRLAFAVATHVDPDVLIVDEAQNLSAEVLEQLRLLTNLETAKQKLLQIILIGQEELRDLLARNDLRQLAQRITGRYHLEPLDRVLQRLHAVYRIRRNLDHGPRCPVEHVTLQGELHQSGLQVQGLVLDAVLLKRQDVP